MDYVVYTAAARAGYQTLRPLTDIADWLRKFRRPFRAASKVAIGAFRQAIAAKPTHSLINDN
jgi:hypothetical protein